MLQVALVQALPCSLKLLCDSDDDHDAWQGDIEGNIRIVRGTLGSEAGKDTEALNGLGAVRALAPVVPVTQSASGLRLAFVALARHDWLSRRWR